MTVLTVLLVMLALWLWATVGYAGFAYWWDRQFGRGNHHSHQALAVLEGAIFGPFTWLIGWRMHGGRGPTGRPR